MGSEDFTMDEIPKNKKPFMMLFDDVWQEAIEVKGSNGKRWFNGREIGFVPEDEIQDWHNI